MLFGGIALTEPHHDQIVTDLTIQISDRVPDIRSIVVEARASGSQFNRPVIVVDGCRELPAAHANIAAFTVKFRLLRLESNGFRDVPDRLFVFLLIGPDFRPHRVCPGIRRINSKCFGEALECAIRPLDHACVLPGGSQVPPQDRLLRFDSGLFRIVLNGLTRSHQILFPHPGRFYP